MKKFRKRPDPFAPAAQDAPTVPAGLRGRAYRRESRRLQRELVKSAKKSNDGTATATDHHNAKYVEGKHLVARYEREHGGGRREACRMARAAIRTRPLSFKQVRAIYREYLRVVREGGIADPRIVAGV